MRKKIKIKISNIEQGILKEEVIKQNKNQGYLFVHCITKINFKNGHFHFVLFAVKKISNIEQGILNEEVLGQNKNPTYLFAYSVFGDHPDRELAVRSVS